jgi:lysosomal alpha-mannosidase
LVYLARNDIQQAGVQYILDSVVLALDENPDRRFIYVEMGFFWRWWLQQSNEMHDKVTSFVNDGKILKIIYLFLKHGILK